jgi:hypothetical protein
VPVDPHERHVFTLERLRPPVEVAVVEGDWDMRIHLAGLWKSVIETFEVDNESAMIDPHGENFIDDLFTLPLDPSAEDYDDHDAQSVAYNLAQVHDKAVTSFMQRIRYLRAPVASSAEYSKHFPGPRARTLDDLKSESRSGRPAASKLLFGLEGNVLDEYAVLAGSEHFDGLIKATGPVYRGAVEASVPMGVSNGVLTPVLMIEWSPQLIHMYPISLEERDEYERGGGECKWEEYLEDKARTSR